MKKIIMCDPSVFRVSYNINPWMKDNIGNINTNIATSQWQKVYGILTEIGCQVRVISSVPDNCPDAVFAANAGVVVNNTFIPSKFRYNERADEENFFINWFSSNGFKVLSDNPPNTRSVTSFEGGGDALFNLDRTKLWLGIGFRTSLSFKPFLESLLEKIPGMQHTIVRPLELVNPDFYHLDTCFCPLDTGELLWYPGAFSEYSQNVIKQWYGARSIEVNEQDAYRFACNAVSVGSNIITSFITPHLEKRLQGRGYKLHTVDMSQFMRSGGGCKCLTLEEI